MAAQGHAHEAALGAAEARHAVRQAGREAAQAEASQQAPMPPLPNGGPPEAFTP
jgi:hypothetical protein